MSAPPHRRFRVNITISGDTMADVEGVLRDMVANGVRTRILGSTSLGAVVTVTEDPEMTPEKFHQELAAYIAADTHDTPKEHPDHECA